MNLDQLHSFSKKDLADRARRLGIAGHAAMSQDELVKAVTRALKKKEKEREKAKPAAPKAKAAAPSLNGKHLANGKPAAPAPVVKKKAEAKKAEPAAPAADLNGKPPRHLQGGHPKD